MPRGTQFGDVIAMFRAEARQSSQVNVGADSLPHVKQIITRVQRTLYAKYDWDFLRPPMQKIQLHAGQRYYDCPAELNIDRIEEAVLKLGSSLMRLDRGVQFADYAIWDSDSGVRSSPTQKYDFRWTGTTLQVEAFPIPADDTNAMWFKCMRPLRPLVDLSDPLDLDDDLVVLFAVAEELAAQKAADADVKMKAALQHLAAIKKNASSGTKDIQMNLGQRTHGAPSKVEILQVTMR